MRALLFPLFLLPGFEHVTIDPGKALTLLDFNGYPFLHTLLTALIWAGVFRVFTVLLAYLAITAIKEIFT